MEYLQLTWTNWGNICDFVPKDNFIIGTFLDNNKQQTDDASFNTIGLFLKLNGEKVLVKQNEYIIKENNTIKIMTKIQFDRKRKLEEINECQEKN